MSKSSDNKFESVPGPHDDPDWLLARHIEGKSHRDIAKLAGVSTPTIRARFRRFGISSRSITDGLLAKSEQLSIKQRARWTDSARAEHGAKMLITQAGRKHELSESSKLNWVRNRDKIMAGKLAAITDEYKKKLSESCKMSWTPERRIEQSRITKELWKSVDYQVRRMVALKIVTDGESFRQKVAQNSLKLWNDARYRELQAVARTTQPSNSILEDVLRRLLAHRGIEARQVAHGPWTFDLGFQHNNINYLIECQGSYWHSLPDVIVRDKQKHTYYERYLSTTYRLSYIYEHQFYGINKLNGIIDGMLGECCPQIDFDYNQVNVGAALREESNQFFWLYHYLGSSRVGLDTAATINGTIIACCRYTGITRLQTADRLGLLPQQVLELNRLCIHPSYHKRNLASWFLARTISHIPEQIKALVAFSDEGAGHTGAVYKAAGWSLDGRTKPSYWYVDNDGHRYHKKSVWDQAKRLRLSEMDYAATMGLCRISGKPVLRFVKVL